MRFESRSTVGLPGLGGVSTNITPGNGGCTIHYVGGTVGIPESAPHSKCRAKMREVHNWHVKGNGWAFFAYSLAVCQHGVVMEGRGVRRRTAANGTNPGNQNWYAILGLVGGSEKPSEAMVQGIKDAVAYLRTSGRAGARVNGHRDHLSTSCPGAPLYDLVRAGVFGSGGSATPTPTPTSPPSSGGTLPTGAESDMVGLKQGDSGERVKFLQELLVAGGFSVGAAGIDGDYGPSTAKAVLACRKAQGSKQSFGDRITGAAAKQVLQGFVKKVAK